MNTNRLTIRILLGMLAGCAAGLLLMRFFPVGIQPGDRLEARLRDGTTLPLEVAGTSRPEKTLDVLTQSGERGKAWLEKEQTAGSVRLPDGRPVSLAGLSLREAAGRISGALGIPVETLRVKERRGVTLVSAPTRVCYVAGELFLRLLKMLIVPLIVSTVLIGVASLGDLQKMGRIGGQTVAYYAVTMLIACGIGLALVNIVRPGDALDLRAAAGGTGLAESPPTVADLVLRIVPSNPVEAMARFDVLGMLFFTILTALAILRLGHERAHSVLQFFEGLSGIVYVLIGWVMSLAPLGVGALLAYFIAIQTPDYLVTLAGSLGKFAFCVAAGLLIHSGVLTLLVWRPGRYPPLEFLRRSVPFLTTAFSTASSSATLPVTLSVVREMNVSRRISSFVIPVGATANMDGTALYEASAVLFLAQAFGVELGFGQQVIVAFTAMLAAVGAAGIPSAGLVTMALVLTAVGLPLTGIGLLLAIDRPLDMLRTAVNVYGDATACRIVQTWNPSIRPEEDDEAEQKL